jgi:hypothetical protein
MIVQQLGLANDPSTPFPHDPQESEELLAALRRHRVLARHGDIYDPINYGESRDVASLGDAIVIELVSRFVSLAVTQFPEELPPEVAGGLCELPHIRPPLLIPVWISGLLDRVGVRGELKRTLQHTWDRLVDEFLQLAIVRQFDSGSPFELIDALEQVLKFSKRVSTGWAARIMNLLHALRGSADESYASHALTEHDFRNRRARHVVYGHTHVPETVPLDASSADGYVLNQIYVNAGTWRRVYRQTRWAPGEWEFIPMETISYAVFYQGDERSGRPFEIWTGVLAASPLDRPVRRLDPSKVINAAEQSIPASRVPVRAPHFRRPVPAAGQSLGRRP